MLSKKEKQQLRSKKHQDKLMSTKEGCIKRRFFETKYRAKKLNIPFDLTLEYLISIFPDSCPVFNTEMSWGHQTGKILPTSPSLDKIDPGKGYVVGNVQWLSNRANVMKHNATLEQLNQFANWVKNTNQPS